MLVRGLAAALAVVTGVALGTGLLTPADGVALADRLWPVMLLVVSMTVVAELASAAGVFAVVAGRIGGWGRGRTWGLWLLVVALATVTTIFLSLDTTAVLVTPVVVLLARACGLPELPFALTTVWLANTGSMLLPVSNLTNLLAQQRLGTTTPQLAALTWAPALVGVLVPVVVVALVFRRRLGTRYRRPGRAEQADPVLLRWSGLVLALLVPALVSGVEVWIPATLAAAALVVLFAVRRREVLRPRLLPAVPVLLTLVLFVVVESLQAVGLTEALTRLAGDGEGAGDLLRLAGVVVVAANLVNNLPAYLAFEPVAGDSAARLLSTLVATNIGPLLTPWGSLATLLWLDRLRALGVHADLRGLGLLGVLVVVPGVTLGVLAVALTTG